MAAMRCFQEYDQVSLRYTLAALLTGTVAVASVSAAQAADLYTPAPAAISYSDAGLAVATDNWSGFYAGAHGGMMSADDFDNTSFSGGVQAGYLQQFGQFVVGAEVSGTLSDELRYELTPDAGLTQNWSLAAKGRAGVALGDTLIYGTAGASLAELEPSGTTTSGTDTYGGVVFGAGVEQNLGNNFSVRAEYLQTRYFDVDSTVAGIARTDDLTNHAVTLGVNYRF